MDNTQILVVGKHEEIMKTIIRLIDGKEQWKGHAAFSAAEAQTLSNVTHIDIVLLGAGLSEIESDRIKTFFTVPVIQHYGGGSGLLYAEIYEGLKKAN
jgi:Asp/Glu/hydantoin racemase